MSKIFVWFLGVVLLGSSVERFESCKSFYLIWQVLNQCIFVLPPPPPLSEWENKYKVECVFIPWWVWSWFFLAGMVFFHCFICFVLWLFSLPFILIIVILFLFMWVWWTLIDFVCYQIWCFDNVLIFSSNLWTFTKSFDMILFIAMGLIMFADMSDRCDRPIGRLDPTKVLSCPVLRRRGRSFFLNVVIEGNVMLFIWCSIRSLWAPNW